MSDDSGFVRFFCPFHFLPEEACLIEITYTQPDGQPVKVAAAGGSLMTAAVENQVDGIVGECGGVCSCATCHVQIDPAWADRVGPPSDAEAAMLELSDGVGPTSRLGCQVELRPELDGLEVKVVGS
jgi:2Fe-2S ferredoxin